MVSPVGNLVLSASGTANDPQAQHLEPFRVACSLQRHAASLPLCGRSGLAGKAE